MLEEEGGDWQVCGVEIIYPTTPANIRPADSKHPKPRKPPTASRDTGKAGLSTNKGKNFHITRKKVGMINNPASETVPGPPQITTEEGANIPGHTLKMCDHKLQSVYRDDGTHLTGGLADDALW